MKRKIYLIFLLLLACTAWNKQINASYRGSETTLFMEKLAYLVTDSTLTLPSHNLIETALSGLEYLNKNKMITRTDIITVIDFTLSANQKRLWVLDLINAKILINSLVSHGRNTGDELAESFSNKPGSYASSPGFFVTSEPYDGRNGFSLAIHGIEKGINDNALKRGVVIHGANYVSNDFIRDNGRLGRSQGCPAVPENLNREIIETIKGGTCLFIYTSNRDYLSKSLIIQQISKLKNEVS